MSKDSAIRVTLFAGGGADTVVLTVEGLLHVRLDTSDIWDDCIDELVEVRLPRYDPWPEEAHHLLHHHNNRCGMTWLRILGPGRIEILGACLTVEVQVSTAPPR